MRQTTFIDGWIANQFGFPVFSYPDDSLEFIRGWNAREEMVRKLLDVGRP
jgi:hypothetical protein